MEIKKAKPIKHYCDNCQFDTNHAIIQQKDVDLSDEDYRFEKKYFMLECMGCENISFRIESHDYEVTYPDEFDNWTYDISVVELPFPLKGHKVLSNQLLLPAKIRAVYRESVNALKANCLLLCGVGFRAVIEAVCLDKKIAGRTLESKINNLSKNRLITDKEAERLHAVRFMGNDSVHEMSIPKKATLYLVLEIIENLLKNLYLIDQRAKSVLDTFITEFGDFLELLERKLRSFKPGDDFPLAKYLEKDVRRLNGAISKFEKELVEFIKKGKFKGLSVGDIKVFGTNTTETFQHFVKQK